MEIEETTIETYAGAQRREPKISGLAINRKGMCYCRSYPVFGLDALDFYKFLLPSFHCENS